MSSPRALVQILIVGSRILGKAFYEAGRQAVKNARQTAATVDVSGVSNATSGSVTDQLTRAHRMTLDEAHLILNVRKGETTEKMLQNYGHLLKANSPAPPMKGKTPAYSHYLHSKVIRARERIEAEIE